MPHTVKRSRRPSLENRVRDILESPAFSISVEQPPDPSLVARLADFIGDFLMAVDAAEGEVVSRSFYEANSGIRDLARAVLREVLAEMST
jgi:hypothetical protein